MRVGQFTDTFLPVVDGVGRVVSSYAKYMGDRCEACYVVTPMQSNLYRGGLNYDIIDFCGVPVPKMRHYQAGLPGLDVHYLRRIAKAKMDIVHAHSPFIAGHEAYRKARRSGIPMIATFHSKFYDDFYQLSKSAAISSVGSNMVADFYTRFDQIWAVSAASATVLREYGFKGPIEIVDNGTERKDPDPEKVRTAEQFYGLSADPLLLFVGQMNWKKNIRRILESAGLLKCRNIPFQLVMAGQGPAEKDIRKLAEELDLSQQVVFTGHVSDPRILDGLYARANLLIFPSLYDNAPMVVREAAALGTPSLLARGSSAAEVVRDDQNGLLAEDSTPDVAARIAWALANPEYTRELGLAAQRTIPRYWDEVIVEILGRYRELIETSKT